MDNLHSLTNDFCKLVKKSEEIYNSNEKVDALINNLKQIHHQIKNSGIELDAPEAFEHLQSALHKIVGAIRDIEAITTI